jgi:hypothetical protein
MFCPRCAKKFDPDTSYCRTCGLSLGGVREIVSGESGTEPEFKLRPNFKLMQIGIAIFIMGMVVALANAALSTAIGFKKDIGTVIFLTMIAIGMAFLGIGFVFPQKRYVKRRSNVEPTADETNLRTAPLRSELNAGQASAIENEFPNEPREPLHVEVQSVTEHTTRQLK